MKSSCWTPVEPAWTAGPLNVAAQCSEAVGLVLVNDAGGKQA
jgi:hypothetical protein